MPMILRLLNEYTDFARPPFNVSHHIGNNIFMSPSAIAEALKFTPRLSNPGDNCFGTPLVALVTLHLSVMF